MIGESLGNHRIVAKIGQGGMGTVYEAEDSNLGRRVAIKILNPALVSNPKELARFQSEAKVQASLNHPNIVTLHEFEPYRDSYYMVMEYVVGRNLADVVRTVGALPTHIVVSLTKQVLDGLSAAHRMGVVHRDLKPSNIMLTPDGVAKVMDFGIAKVQGGQNLTATGALVGTVYYMSPEQVRGETVDARSDIYSLGIILFELLTGRVPFKEESDFSIMMHHVRTPPPPPTQFLPEIPGPLEDIVLRCLQKEPAARFQQVEDILGPLETFEEQERALGRSPLYSRRTLAQWLAAAANRAMTRAESAPPVATPPVVSLGAERPFTAPKVNLDGGANAAGQPLHIAKPHGGTFLVIAIVFVALVFVGMAYFILKKGPAMLASWKGSSKVNVSQAQVGGTPVAQASSAQTGTPPSTGSAAPTASTSDSNKSSPPPNATSSLTSPTGNPSPVKSVPSAQVHPVAPPRTARTDSKDSLGFATGDSRSRPSTSGPAQSAAQFNGPQALLIFMDLDQSGERLPLASAHARVAEILRQSGKEVVSSGALSSTVRSALDRGDLGQVRRSGVGYVVQGSAHGSLEAQNAYGSTYYVAKVKVNLEMVRMSDGKVAATGSSLAKSRGTANSEAALSDALLTATSDAARDLLRNFQP